MTDPPPAAPAPPAHSPAPTHRAGSDVPFFVTMTALGGSYILLILGLLIADIAFTSPKHFAAALAKPEIQYAVKLTLITCSISALLSIWVATPLGYLLSRFNFRGRWLIDTAIDIPVVLPPLVIGLSLLILFHLPVAGTNLEEQCQRFLRPLQTLWNQLVTAIHITALQWQGQPRITYA